MKKFPIVLAILCFPFFAICQKKISKKIINAQRPHIQIDGGNCFRIDIETIAGNELIVEGSLEGEYARDLAIKLEEDGDNVLISTGFLPNFDAPNDKLSAHKIISIALSIRIPEYSQVQLFGTYSNITAKGIYNALDISVADGNCSLQAYAENTSIKTQTGEIVVTGTKGIVNARTKFGQVYRGNIPRGNYN